MIPQHVLTAFNASQPAPRTGARPEAMGPAWDNGYRIGSTVYSEATDTAHWSAMLREKLTVPGLRIARPLRTTDGRFTVGGWKASAHIPGQPLRRYDETVMVALRLADALADIPGPTGLERSDLFAEAEREAFRLADEHFGELELPLQSGHADVLASTIYDGTAVPGVTEIVPFADPRPRAMSAALAIVDAMIIEAETGVDTGLLDRFAHVEKIEDLALRAVYYRDIVAERHPRTNSITRSNVRAVRDALVSRRSATI